MTDRRRHILDDEFVGGLMPGIKPYYVWDKKTCGFGIRVGTSGKRSFVGKLNHPGGKSKWVTLKHFGTEGARLEYSDLMRQDPCLVNGWMGHQADQFARQMRGIRS